MSDKAGEDFSGRIRPRACGLIISSGRLLLVKIDAPTREYPFWIPPGGGISFQETAADAARREVFEETGLEVGIRRLVFVSEYIHRKWHALEYYFQCDILAGEIKLGSDPEFSPGRQMLQDIAWFGPDELADEHVFPVFIRDYRNELLSGAEMPLRYVKQ